MEISSGAADDLQLARHMVMNRGMSESLGPVGYRSGLPVSLVKHGSTRCFMTGGSVCAAPVYWLCRLLTA